MADRLPSPLPGRLSGGLAAAAPLGDSPARTARRALAGALAAELGHDLQGPLNLFRMSVDRLQRGEQLDGEDLSLLVEELGRLSALNARLRDLARAPLARSACSPRALIERALVGLPGDHDLLIDVSSPALIDCDPQLLSVALRELVDNALEAKATRAGVRFDADEALGFCVWDDGPGPSLTGNAAFNWGTTTRAGAAGLGLTLALRAARAHGFELELRRVPPLTEARLLLPARALRPQGVP